MTNILFVNPPSAFGAYDETKVTVFKQVFPLLSFLSLSATLKRHGFTTAVLDLGIEHNPYELLRQRLKEVNPLYIGITSTTPLFYEVKEIAAIAKEILGDKVTVVYGGPHASILPEESLKETKIDIVVIGEGEQTITEILQSRKLSLINGICYKDNGQFPRTPPREFIKDLDSLPFPDMPLYDVSRYHCASLVGRGSPIFHMETSRGCPSGCTYCNKSIFERLFRKKSAGRVVEEFKYFIAQGARDIRVIDDQFATDIERAKEICRLLIKENIKIPWNLANGVRVDRVDKEFLCLAKQAGCYQIAIGFESGDQNSLDSVDKGILLEDAERCARMFKEVDIESVGFFMIGLPGDTEESLKKTIQFAKRVMPTYAKTTVTIPFPGTRLFEQYDREGRIKSRNWAIYNTHKIADIYEHPNLSQETLKRYYNLFYRDFYLNPRYLAMRFVKSLKDHTFWRDVYYGLKTFLPDMIDVLRFKKK